MFNNIGGKIKVLAKITCYLGMLLSLVCAIALWAANSRFNNTVFTGFLTLIGGSIVSWLSSFFCYGFGQMVESMQNSEFYLAELVTQNKELLNPAPVGKHAGSTSRATTHTQFTV